MLAITTDSFEGYGLDRAFEISAAAGFDGIEVSIQHGVYDSYDADYLNLLSARHKLPIIAVSTPHNMSGEKANRVIDLALKVGAQIVTLTPPDIFDFDYKKWIKEEVSALRRKKKITIALVNPPIKTVFGILPKYAYTDVYQLREFEDLALDTSNSVNRTEPLLEVYSILKNNVKHVHLANSRRDRSHTLLSDGNLPLESFLTRLARDNYKGAIVLRLSPHSLGVGKLDKVMSNLENCKKFITKYFRRERE